MTDKITEEKNIMDNKTDGMTADGETLRLNLYISRSGLCSRREADRLIEEGRVSVDGVKAVQGMRVSGNNKVMVNGQLLQAGKQPSVILAVNKPVGYVCTTDRRWGDPLLTDLVKSPVRVFHMGRLDKDSEGLILMTNRGDLLNKIMKASAYHEKEYLVTIDRKVSEEFLQKMAGGVYLPELDVTTRPCRVVKEAPYSFRIVLTQGLNRQIRRMCVTLGCHVRSLKRVRIMNIELGDLAPGKQRMLTEDETSELMRQLDMPAKENADGGS